MSAAPVNVVREALERAGCNPRGADHVFVAHCPAHDDRTPSLSVTEGRDGKAVLHCFAGCNPRDVIAAVDLTWADLFPPDPLDGPHWRALRDRYTELAAKVPAEIAKVEARRQRDADVLLDVLVQLLRTGRSFSGSLAFECPWCGVGYAWIRRDRNGLVADCDAGCSEHHVLGALAKLERAA